MSPPAPSIASPSEGSYDTDGAFILSGKASPLTIVKIYEETNGQQY